jgi:DnaJ family protein C protein 11
MDRRARILGAVTKIDQASYYDLLSVRPGVDSKALQAAFHRLALVYHPDRHVDDDPEVREAARRVFQRGVEAYTVLRDAQARALYDRVLAKGQRRLRPAELEKVINPPPEAPPVSRKPRTFSEMMTTPDGCEIAERVERFEAEGRLTEALTQLGMLEQVEPDNAAVSERARKIALLVKRRSR